MYCVPVTLYYRIKSSFLSYCNIKYIIIVVILYKTKVFVLYFCNIYVTDNVKIIEMKAQISTTLGQ